ncbi:SPX domain-containing protein [Irpex rosettiformis]|uniref:SPX domain-containing protein n=1 Tax=Irpex rosettiformis TaxID=378272 RepID=A0ACB8U034_9APHY|nr:SPX domain-containing protein [Irpex rosettiformis]
MHHAIASSSRPRAKTLLPQENHPSEDYTEQTGILRATTLNMGFFPRLGRGGKNVRHGHGLDMSRSIPLKDLIPALNPLQKAFFDKLDGELDKVETFYIEREKEMHTKVSVLKGQLHELQEHRRVFHEAEGANSWLHLRRGKVNNLRYQSPAEPSQRAQSKSSARKRRGYKGDSDTLSRPTSNTCDAKNLEEAIENPPIKIHSETSDEGTLRNHAGEANGNGSGSGSGSGSGGSGGEDVPKGWKKVRHNFQKHVSVKNLDSPGRSEGAKYDPDEYIHAKKSLKKAVLECYRGLEVLENYRTLNLIGFRKALKKFEKVTQQAYFLEKIEPSAFSSGTAVQGMISQVEEMYATRFSEVNPLVIMVSHSDTVTSPR